MLRTRLSVWRQQGHPILVLIYHRLLSRQVLKHIRLGDAWTVFWLIFQLQLPLHDHLWLDTRVQMPYVCVHLLHQAQLFASQE
jgi:hypothetical protein